MTIIHINHIHKLYTYTHILPSVKTLFQILPKHNEYDYISESFALNWYIFTSLTYKNLLVPL